MNIEKATQELHKGFALLNKSLFNNELPNTALTIQSQGRKQGILGWCTVGEVWTDRDGKHATYEINITAEHLNRTVDEIMCTLIHEMVHLDNAIKGIKDTSRGYTYHNKKFKQTAEDHGLVIGYDDRIGHSPSTLKPETVELIASFNLDAEAFNLARISAGGVTTTKGSSQSKWVCECGTAIRASKEINVICGDCETQFVREG